MSADALTALANELDVVATWFSGPKSARVQRLAEQARALATGQQVDPAQIAVSAATTAAPQPVPADVEDDEEHLQH